SRPGRGPPALHPPRPRALQRHAGDPAPRPDPRGGGDGLAPPPGGRGPLRRNDHPDEPLSAASDGPDADQLAYVRVLLDGSVGAVRRTGGSVDRHYRIGGETVCLRFAGAGLIASTCPALEHLTTSPVPRPDLTICLWDSATTGRPLPLLAASLLKLLKLTWPEARGVRGEIRGYDGERVRAAHEGGGEERADILSRLDARTGLAACWGRD